MKKLIAVFIMFLITACTTQQQMTPPPQENHPAVTDEQAILSVLNQEVKNRLHTNVSLNVHYLKIYHNWAYVETTGGGDPGINAVMKKVNGHWMLAKRVKACHPVCPQHMQTCADGELICKNTLHQQFPAAPMMIFPTASSRTPVFNP